MKEDMNKEVPATPARGRAGHSLEFRRDSVSAWHASGLSVPVYARQIGVNSSTLYAWIHAEGVPLTGVSGGPAPAARTLEQAEAELRAMRAELDRTRLQRDILKKTLGIVCEPPPNAMPGSQR